MNMSSLESALQNPFGLLILDGLSLNRLWHQIRSRKEAEGELFLPLLLVTGSKNLAHLTRELWSVIDEIVQIPTDRRELALRVESLLRARNYSKEAEQRYYTLAETGGVGVAIVQEKKIVWANSALSGMLNVLRENILQTTITQILHPEDMQAVSGLLEQSAGFQEAREVRLKAGQHQCWVKLQMAPIVYKGQNALLLMATDTTELKLAFMDTVYRLAQAAEYKDEDTGVHILRIGHYSNLLAQKYGVSSKDVDNIRTAAPLHDVGKIGIPESILQKPDKLTREEFQIIKTHSEIGARLLQGSQSEVLETARIIAWTHHEKFNGQGYPRGLQGENIPLEGRIVALCDVWDALISKRPYKEGFPIEKALEIIKSERGQHFDPDLVDIFWDNLDTIVNLREEINARANDLSELKSGVGHNLANSG